MAEPARLIHRDDGRMRDMGGREATVEDLYREPGKAELVDGKLVVMTPGGGTHGYAAIEIVASLREHARRFGTGVAIGDNVGFLVRLPNRRSFCPDAAFWTGGPLTEKFFDGAPVFAVEVRSPEDYGASAERRLAAKRADYFAAGTLVVWDVDLRGGCVNVYRAARPDSPDVSRRGEHADAEPAVPGWSMPVDDLFPEQR
jgi:Uma2 family endonuclease